MNLPATELYLFPSTPCHHPHWCSLLILLPSFYPLWVCSGFWSWTQPPSWGPSDQEEGTVIYLSNHQHRPWSSKHFMDLNN